MKRTNQLRALGVLLGELLLFPLAAGAIGQITEPILLADALRGRAYERTVSIVNTEKNAATISLGAAGEIAGWVSFLENADGAPLEKVVLAAGEKQDVLARFAIPAGAPNRTYAGTIDVSGAPGQFEAGAENSGSSVTQKIEREVTITVSDQEKVDFDVSLIPASYDLTPGELLRIRVLYDNRSNIDIRPQIDFKVKEKGETDYSVIFPYGEMVPAVKPAAIYEIPALEIPTSNLTGGKYTASFRISEGDKFSLEKEFDFSIGLVKGASTAAPKAGTAEKRIPSELILIVTILLFLLVLLHPKFAKSKGKIRTK